ncbi:MAG: hypothetical protein U5R31_04665 [Acidimicrobiia bacterium]|nr:hypothetical protein [Acidimicrobiia bacterium]
MRTAIGSGRRWWPSSTPGLFCCVDEVDADDDSCRSGCFGRAFWPLFWLGLMIVGLAGGSEGFEADHVDSVGDAIGELASPLAGLLVAVGVRLVSAGLGFVLAWRVARSTETIRRPFGSHGASFLPLVVDQLPGDHAIGRCSWTKAVRIAAADQLGHAGDGASCSSTGR